MWIKRGAAVLVAAFTMAACADEQPVATERLGPDEAAFDRGGNQAEKGAERAGLLTGIPVTIDGMDAWLSVTHLSHGAGGLLADGTITWQADGNTYTEVFSDVPAELSRTETSAMALPGGGFAMLAQRGNNEAGACDILFLDLGPIFLDLLGLTVDLSAIQLDIDAQRGSGNLLGNLLCAVTGLLDGGPLAAIGNLLDQINQILSGAGQLLQNVPVTGQVLEGGVFEGTTSITSLALEDGVLMATGVLNGTVNQGGTLTSIVNETFTVTADLTETLSGVTAASSSGPPSLESLFVFAQRGNNEAGTCDILFLDLGPIFLDLLGLTVDLSAIELDIDAQRGQGNLLGNLLCALTGLLDGGPLAAIQGLIDQINGLLGNLTGGLSV